MDRFRPEYARALILKDDLLQLSSDYEDACEAGAFSRAADIKDCIRDVEHMLFICGVPPEDDR